MIYTFNKPFCIYYFQVEKIIKNKIQDNWAGFTKAFLQIDLNQDGLISKNELAELLSRYAIPMTKESFDKYVPFICHKYYYQYTNISASNNMVSRMI